MPIFSRNKSGLEIPPVDNGSARNELLSSRGGSRGRSVSPRPPSYRTAPPSTHGDEDHYSPRTSKQDPYSRPTATSTPSGASPIPGRFNRTAIGDPYARGGNIEADRAQLFAGYDPNKNTGGDRADRFGGDAGGLDDEESRQFQTQEEEDEEVEGIKQETRYVKQESVNSTRNALRIAREAEETARNTLTRLGDQSGL